VAVFRIAILILAAASLMAMLRETILIVENTVLDALGLDE
jgi:hypothetical protein